MKQFRLLLTILTLLAVGSMNTWAETLTISGASSGHNAPWTTQYKSGNGTSTTSGGSTIGITYTQTARMSTAIQIKAGASNGFYSTTFPANSVITSIAITSKTNSVTLYVSKDGKSWGAGTTISKTTTKTYSAADGYLYFKVNATTSYAQITSIVVTYETATSCTIPLEKPTGLSTTNVTATSAELSWTEVPNATKYLVTYIDANVPGAKQENATATTYTLTNLTPSTQYSWSVKAIGDGTTYCDSEDSQTTGGFTTAALPEYTITWSANGTTHTTTQVTPGDKVVLPTTDPTSCSSTYTNFVGWFTEAAGSESNPSTAKPATQVTATTVPTGKATYYAVFSDATELETTLNIPNNTLIGSLNASYSDKSFSVNGYSFNLNACKQNDYCQMRDNNTISYIEIPTLSGRITKISTSDCKNGSGSAYNGTLHLKTTKTRGNSDKDDIAKVTYSSVSSFSWDLSTTNATSGFLVTSAGLRLKDLSITYLATTPATGYISSCCNDPAVVTVTPATTTINLGEDGKATTTVACTQQNGVTAGKWSYSVSPSTATFDGTNFVAAAAGEYTLTATYTENCGKSGMATITVTNTPVLYFPTTPADPIEFGTVECGGNTPLENKQSISLRGYNLTSDVTVTVTGDYKIAGTESAALADYTTSLILPKDAVSGSSASVYVLSTPPIPSSSPTTGTVTFTTAGGNTLEVNLSTPIITCTEYTLTLNDRGSMTTFNYYAGEKITTQPTDPTGVCTEPINYIFDGWATAEVAEGSTTYTKVSFPYTMPKANTTLYAVYKYSPTISNDYQKITAKESLTDGEYLIVGSSSSTYKALSSIEGSTDGQYKAVAVTPISNVITTDNETLIWNISVENGKYTIAQGGQYLNINNSVMVLESTAIPYTLTVSSGVFTFTTTDSKSSSATKISYYANNSVFNAYRNANTIYLYRRQQDTYYTTSPVCGPYVRITSGKELYVTAGNAGGTRSSVQVQDTVKFKAGNLQGNNGNQPKIKIPAADIICNGAATDKVEAVISQTVTDNGDGTYSISGTIVLTYKPVAFDVREDITLQLRAEYNTGNDVMLDAVTLHARSLPEKFVIVAKNTDWYALNADMSGSSSQPANSHVTVDETAATAVAPCNTLYTFDGMPKGGDLRYVRFVGVAGKYLWAASAENVGIQNYAGNTPAAANDSYNWLLTTSDNVTYTFSNLQNDRMLRLYDSKFAMYVSGVQEFRILPVTDTCVFNYAPANFRKKTVKSTSATLAWDAVAGATMYQLSTDGTTWTDVAATSYTLTGLKAATPYTCYLRARHGDGTNICSEVTSLSFTTTDCDDVPVDLWVSPTANAATIMWSAKAPTATVKIYADEQGNNLVTETLNATTPCKIIGLEQNTNYYYQVLADGSCASAIAHFKTESNEVSIVEWKKDAVIVDLNTEVTDADEVSILVENQHTHGTNNQNIADDLFFSKYYEASGNVKLVAIYNGTKDTLPLTNVKIKIGKTFWDKTIQMSKYGKYKSAHIAPDEEIILWCKGNSNSFVDKKISDCVAGKMDTTIMNEDDNVVFGGPASIGLFRADTLIDMIGAGTKNLPKEGTTSIPWADTNTPNGWLGSGYDIENPSTEIELSTNRCLLVRSNKVKTGRNAVLNNTTTFATFTKDEWLGRQVTKGDDNGVTESCNGFAYVADFNYNDYYTTYDSIAHLEIKGNRNEDGTYTIPVLKLDTMACTNLRLQLKKNGTIQATREEKVPIIIYETTDTKSTTFFGDKLTDEICKTCDVVVRDKAQLSHTAGGKQQFRDMYVYTGSSLNIPAEQTMSLDKVRMFATNDSVSYAIVNNSADAAAAISVKEVSHVKRIDGRYWYPFSLPYDCNIADIDQLNGQPLGVYGTDWGIKYYDGQHRQSDGNSTTHYGEVSKYWTMMPEDDVLKAYTGYIIGLFVPAADEPLMKSVNFPPATESAYTENASSKTTPITNWPDNLSAEPRHHGWNFVGSPYISLFGSNNNTQGEGLYNTQVQMGWTDALGKQQDKDHIYVSIPNGGNSNTYTQALASGVTIKPFTAYFVQAIDPIPGQGNTLDLTYSKNQRRLPTLAPARTAKTDALILTELDITNGALGDNTGVLVSNVYSAEYEIGDDLTKMYAAAQKPQLYTIDAHNDKMAYQALPDVLAHAIPLGIYVPQAGDYTLSLNRYVSRLEAAEAVYLLHNGAVVANLLLSDYTVAASAKGTISGYSLDIRRAPEVVTDIVPAAGDAPYIIARDGVLAIANLPADAVVQVYDVLGHRLLQTDTHAAGTLQVPVPQTGVYTVVITTADGQQVLKTLLR